MPLAMGGEDTVSIRAPVRGRQAKTEYFTARCFRFGSAPP